MRLASLAMYVSPPPVARATEALWAFIHDRLLAAGVDDVPSKLDLEIAYDTAWLRSDLLLSQTCGFPYATKLRGKVRLVATPVYDLPGCDGATTISFIVVRKDDPARSIADLRGRRAAINDPNSNSGANLLRAAIAPLAENGRFFGSVVETGGHLASIAAVSEDRADVAAIDCVTFGNTRRFDPTCLDGIRVIAETERGPGLPFITGARTSEEELALLRQVLAEVASAPELAEVRDTLSLRRFEVLSDSDYDRLLELQRRAVEAGYPDVA